LLSNIVGERGGELFVGALDRFLRGVIGGRSAVEGCCLRAAAGAAELSVLLELVEDAQVDAVGMMGEDGPAPVRDPRDSPAGARQQAGLDEMRQGPRQPVVEAALTAARQQFRAFVRGQVEAFSEGIP
jgi:hypothetical protein